MLTIKKNKYLISLLLLLLLVGIVFSKFSAQNRHTTVDITAKQKTVQNTKEIDEQHKIPEKVYKVLQYVETNHKAMPNYVGGRQFQNREKKLPLYTPNKKRIAYQEWDVNPKVSGVNRGAERLITGNDKSAWFTNNHYRTFTKIK